MAACNGSTARPSSWMWSYHPVYKISALRSTRPDYCTSALEWWAGDRFRWLTSTTAEGEEG